LAKWDLRLWSGKRRVAILGVATWEVEMSMNDVRVPESVQRRSVVDPASASLHARGVLRDRLIADFPSVAPQRIGALVDEAYARTRGARVHAFCVPRAEHEVRTALHAEHRR
jgi:hypothetical protein